MNPVCRIPWWHNCRQMALGVMGLGTPVLVLPLAAQERPPEVVHIIDAAGGGPDFDTRTLRRGFDLFAAADAAFSGMRMTGDFGVSLTNYGDCHSPLYNCQNTRVRVASDRTVAPFFEVQWAYGVPPSQFSKIRNVAPSVSNATGGGWMAGYNQTVLGRPLRFGPHDGTLGRMFSGTTATADGTCRDHTGFSNGTTLAGTSKVGLQILPASDCPETWGSEDWQGAHPIDGDGWKRWFDRQGQAFTWDFWRVPEEFQRADRSFLGTNHHVYGETSDYSAEVLANYGNVIPGGVGAPRYQGYPLGLLIRFEAFNFAVPTINDAYFIQATIINRSADLWGQGIDYDSLYFGLSQGNLFLSSAVSRYARPETGTVIYHENNVRGAGGPCDQPFRRPYGATCLSNSSTFRGYGAGAVATLFLKTPLGDLRNKLFTRTHRGDPCSAPVDPFCSPSHALAGDTITFNRQTFGDFGGAEAVTFGTGTRAAFGFMAAMEENTLAGRDINSFNERTAYTTFRSEFWPVNRAHYNKYLPPGGWDYNHDGILDTLALDTCGRFGCVELDWDTMPGGWLNLRGNVGGLQSFGPFSLRAGDTTSLVYAMVGSRDSLRLWTQIDAVTSLYLNAYLVPDAAPAPSVLSSSATPGTDQRGTADPRVRFRWSDSLSHWVDPYLSKFADDIDAAVPASYLGTIRTLNAWLVDSIRTRAANNVERLEIYKSCDGGVTFTADTDCAGDPTVDVDGGALGVGWRYYASLGPDLNGTLPNTFTDDGVQDGRTYTYVVVAKTRGARYLIATSAGPDSLVIAPSIRNLLSRSGTAEPNVISVYVPVSRSAGYQPPRARFTVHPPATVPFLLDLTDSVGAASYRAVFGSEIVVHRDSSGPGGFALPTTIYVQRREIVNVNGSPQSTIIRSEAFTYPPGPAFLVSGAGSTTGPFVLADTVRSITTYPRLGFVLVGPDGPIFGGTTLDGTATMPAGLPDRPEFPGFTLQVNNNLATNATLANTYDAASEKQLRGARSIDDLNLSASDSVVPRELVDAFMVQFREGSSLRTADGKGVYEVTWTDDPFGVDRGFTLAELPALEAEVRTTLLERRHGDRGLTDAVTANLLAVDQITLVPVRVPFRIRNLIPGRQVDVAMLRRQRDILTLGSGRDTLSVRIPDDHWVPGDRLFLMENVLEDSTTPQGLVLDAEGQPVQRVRRVMSFASFVLGCNSGRESCNPLRQGQIGATGYNPMRSGDKTRLHYYVGIRPDAEYAFDVIPPVTGALITALTDSALARIRVVPNPFLLYSHYQTAVGEPRLLFTNVPPRGTLRIYTVAGQLVQQITWEPADLRGDGDLFWNLRAHTGNLVASGLYVWVLTAPSNPADANSAAIRARGKLVVVQGSPM